MILYKRLERFDEEVVAETGEACIGSEEACKLCNARDRFGYFV